MGGARRAGATVLISGGEMTYLPTGGNGGDGLGGKGSGGAGGGGGLGGDGVFGICGRLENRSYCIGLP